MPLLRRREFRPVKLPKELKPTEEVFLCRLTNEIFRDYDDFFKRTILCNSLVWSCSLTGRPGLTYQEALESEEKALKFLSSFPVYLETPVLLLARMTKRGRLSDLCEDIFGFVKDRFFVGEIVDVVHLDTRETCRVNRVIVPPDFMEDVIVSSESSDDEVIFIKDDGREEKLNTSHGEQKTPKRTLKPQMLKPAMYRYEVTSLQGSGTYIAPHNNVGRKRGLFTKEKNKLYLKHHCKVIDYIWSVKPQYVERFQLNKKAFGEYFAGPVPNFSSTPAKRNVHKVMEESSGESSADDDTEDDDDEDDEEDDDDDLPLMEVKKKAEAKMGKKKKKKNKGANKENQVAQPKMSKEERVELREKMRAQKMAERMEVRQKVAEERALEKAKKWEELAKLKEEQKVQREKERLVRREQMRKDFEESKERRRKKKEEERERQRAYYMQMKEYMKPREDLECEDQKDLPEPVPLSGRIPQELFGDSVLLLEFLHAYEEELGLKEDFPEGVTLELLADAITTNKVDGALFDITRFFLKALFRVQEEDEEEWKTDLEEQGIELPKVSIGEAKLEEDPDPTYAAMSKAATAALAWPVVHQGTELRKLPIDPPTLTEIVRLHFLSSGASTGSEDSKWRYQQRGGYTCHDDPGLEFRMQESGILKTLTKGNIYDLGSEGKLKVLTALTNQLLTYVTIREVIEDGYDTWVTTRRELRDLLRGEQRREKEEVTAKWRLRMEERATDKFQVEKDRLAKLSQEGIVENGVAPGVSGSNVSTPEQPGSRPQSRAQGESPNDSMETSEVPTPGLSLADIEKKRRGIAEESAEKKAEFLMQEAQLAREITEAIMKYNVNPIGEDRFFRRYWKFNSLPGLFVECDRNIDEDVMKEMEEDMHAAQRTKVENQGAPEEIQPTNEHNTSNSSNKENVDSNVIGNGPVANGDVPADSHKDLTDAEKETPMEVSGGEMPVLSVEAPSAAPTPAASQCRWAFYNDPNQIDKLLEALNTRGLREAPLRDSLQQEKAAIVGTMAEVPTDFLTKIPTDEVDADYEPGVKKQVEVKMNSGKKGLLSNSADGDEKLELMLREQILDIEDRLWQGALGFVKVNNRASWVEAIEQGSYARQSKEISWGPVWARSLLDDGDFLNMSLSDLPLPEEKPKSKDRLSALKKSDLGPTGSPASTRCNTPDPADNVVRDLACALLQVSQGADDKYLKAPLGNPEENKPMTRTRKKQEEEKEEEEDEEEEKKPKKTCRECWEESLMACTSLSQIFLHLSTLERSVTWNKSILKARCRMCRRGGNPEAMLLCDSCNRGHHMFCLKPPLKNVPKGDWFCKDCAPKQIKRSPHKQRAKKKPVVEESSSSEEEEEEESEDSSEEEKSEEEEEEEMEVDVSEIEEEDEEEEEEEEEDEDEDEDNERKLDAMNRVARRRLRGLDHNELCQSCGHGGQLILCYDCPIVYHCECLVPPLSKLAQDQWCCPLCVQDRAANGAESEEEVGSEDEGIEHEDVCFRCRHGGALVCCDTCPKAFHTECCKPVLRKVPKGQWECEDCKKGAKSAAIRVPTGKKGPAKKFAAKPAKKESPKTQPKAQEKTSSRSRSQSRGRQSRQNTPEPSAKNSKTTKKGDAQPASGSSGKKGQQSSQEKKGQQSSQEKKGPQSSQEKKGPQSSQEKKGPQSSQEKKGQQSSSSSQESRGRSGAQEKKGGRGKSQDRRGASLERKGQKRGMPASVESTDSETSSQEEVQKKRNSGRGLFKVALNGSLNADDSASDSSGPSTKNRRSSSGRGRGDLTQLNKCESLLKELIKHPDARPFLNAVSKKAAPDYYRIIKRPMDFSSMQTKVNDYQYSSPAELIADARLIFTNCQQYNRRSSPEYKAGLKMSTFLEKRIKELDIEVSLENEDTAPVPATGDQDTPTSRKRSRQR